MATLIDGMGKRIEQVTEELSNVRKQLEKMEQEKMDKTLKVVFTMFDSYVVGVFFRCKFDINLNCILINKRLK